MHVCVNTIWPEIKLQQDFFKSYKRTYFAGGNNNSLICEKRQEKSLEWNAINNNNDASFGSCGPELSHPHSVLACLLIVFLFCQLLQALFLACMQKIRKKCTTVALVACFYTPRIQVNLGLDASFVWRCNIWVKLKNLANNIITWQ